MDRFNMKLNSRKHSSVLDSYNYSSVRTSALNFLCCVPTDGLDPYEI